MNLSVLFSRSFKPNHFRAVVLDTLSVLTQCFLLILSLSLKCFKPFTNPTFGTRVKLPFVED